VTALHVEVTAEDIAGAEPGKRGWSDPVEAALARLTGQQVDVDGGEFGQRSLHAADATGHAVDFVAWLESGYVRPQCFDSSGYVGAEDDWERLEFGFALTKESVPIANSCRLHADEQLPRTR